MNPAPFIWAINADGATLNNMTEERIDFEA